MHLKPFDPSVSRLRFCKDGKFIARANISVTPVIGGVEVIEIKLRADISPYDEPMKSGLHKICRNEYSFLISNPPYLKLTISDFMIPHAARGCGIGRYIWHVIYKGLPQAISKDLTVLEKISSNDDYGDNAGRRNALWNSLCSTGSGQGANWDIEHGMFRKFSGPLNDPWNQALCQSLCVESVSGDVLSEN